MACDALQYCLGAVLLARVDDGSKHAIACAARNLPNAERNFNLEKETSTLMFGEKEFLQYIYGSILA